LKDGRDGGIPTSFQFFRSLLAWRGIPGNELKEDVAQRKIPSWSSKKMQLGSGWKPGSTGF
jgi:hypothetical protein